MDFILSLCAIMVLSLVFLPVSILIRIKLGAPVIFKQKRPGMKDKNGNERIFTLYKFRTMTDERDNMGELLPDDLRLTRFGQRLRDTSLDELPELFNILKGDMSIIGPRPQLVQDMVFMTPEQRQRHTVRPGLSGWAQINGRNCIEWEDKFKYDLEYLTHVTFLNDWRIIFLTVGKVLKCENTSYEGMATAENFGDHLLRCGTIDEKTYQVLQAESEELLNGGQRAGAIYQ